MGYYVKEIKNTLIKTNEFTEDFKKWFVSEFNYGDLDSLYLGSFKYRDDFIEKMNKIAKFVEGEVIFRGEEGDVFAVWFNKGEAQELEVKLVIER